MTISGIDDVANVLEKIAPREANNIMRATIHGVAGELRDDARLGMPVDEGTMKKSTVVKRRRAMFGQAKSDVIVTRGAFYWRFMEYGQGPGGVEYGMFLKAVHKFRGEMHRTFISQFGQKFEKRLARLRKKT